MPLATSRDLRNHTSALLDRVRAGERVTVTVGGEPVAVLVPAVKARRTWLAKAELLPLFVQADAGLRRELAELGDSDDLGPIA